MSGYGRLHGWVTGVVQGVGFRYFAQRKASHYGLTGWVRNLPDDRVEFLAEGPLGILKDYLKEMQIGPPSGQVDNVQVVWEKYRGEFKNFRIGI